MSFRVRPHLESNHDRINEPPRKKQRLNKDNFIVVSREKVEDLLRERYYFKNLATFFQKKLDRKVSYLEKKIDVLKKESFQEIKNITTILSEKLDQVDEGLYYKDYYSQKVEKKDMEEIKNIEEILKEKLLQKEKDLEELTDKNSDLSGRIKELEIINNRRRPVLVTKSMYAHLNSN